MWLYVDRGLATFGLLVENKNTSAVIQSDAGVVGKSSQVYHVIVFAPSPFLLVLFNIIYSAQVVFEYDVDGHGVDVAHACVICVACGLEGDGCVCRSGHHRDVPSLHHFSFVGFGFQAHGSATEEFTVEDACGHGYAVECDVYVSPVFVAKFLVYDEWCRSTEAVVVGYLLVKLVGTLG